MVCAPTVPLEMRQSNITHSVHSAYLGTRVALPVKEMDFWQEVGLLQVQSQLFELDFIV